MGFGGGISGGAGGGGGTSIGGYDYGGGGGWQGGYKTPTTAPTGSPLGGHGDPVGAITGVLGPTYGTGTNYAYELTPAGLTRIGVPSFAGGMMGTAAGQRSAGYTPAHYQNLQSRIVREAAQRRGSEAALGRQIEARKGPNPHEYARDLGLLSQGKLGELEAKGYDVSGMRETHHSGGLLGAMFGNGGDDVQTMDEVSAGLQEAGHVTVDPTTGALTPAGYGPMSPGFAVSMLAPGIAQKAAEYTYGAIGSPEAAMTAGRVAGMGTAAIGKEMQPSGFGGLAGKAVTGGMGLAGIPGATQLGQMTGAMQTAADLGYAGITAPSATPVDSLSPMDTQYLYQQGLLG